MRWLWLQMEQPKDANDPLNDDLALRDGYVRCCAIWLENSDLLATVLGPIIQWQCVEWSMTACLPTAEGQRLGILIEIAYEERGRMGH